MNNFHNKKIGKIGEDIASDYLEKRGYFILERNFREKTGEIDIIAKRKKLIVFVEVKTRLNTKYGFPSEAVNTTKKRKIQRTSLIYLYKRGFRNVQTRYDIIEIIIEKEKFYRINHIRNMLF